jgi:putative component of membrane protein insertase Oxa1/YidC/SpoIIIJ protein YidD
MLLLSVVVYAQTDLHRWGKADISYEMKSPDNGRSYGIESGSAGDVFVSYLTNVYWIFISDVDGDNCSFSPTCSSFFVESVKETNLFQGILMFSDRLARDTNFIDRQLHYPFAKNGRLYDPPANYKLVSKNIKYIPPFSPANDE